jgi:hypothetical protein
MHSARHAQSQLRNILKLSLVLFATLSTYCRVVMRSEMINGIKCSLMVHLGLSKSDEYSSCLSYRTVTSFENPYMHTTPCTST